MSQKNNKENPGLANQNIPRLQNNDPLAHVYLLMQGALTAQQEHRIEVEFITGMGERLENQPFCSTYGFGYLNGEIVYDTGILYLQSLENSVEAAARDVRAGTFTAYHLERQLGFLSQGLQMKDWLEDTSETRHLLFFSLCPQQPELSIAEAEKQSFKPDRLMASVQLHSKNNDGSGSTVAFSLDGLTLDSLSELFHSLGIDGGVAETTQKQLVKPLLIDENYTAQQAVEKIIATYDQLLFEKTSKMHSQGIDVENNIVEANSFVRSRPEAYRLYRKIIDEVALSLASAKVSAGLAGAVYTDLVSAYLKKGLTPPQWLNFSAGDYFNLNNASMLVDYLFRKAIPGYLIGKIPRNVAGTASSSSDSGGSGYSIGDAGVSAQQSGKVYDGGCPTSGPAMQNALSDQQSNNSTEQAKRLGLKPNAIVKYQYHKGYCVVPNCPSGDKDEKVPVGPCSVCKDCQENLYDKGIDAVKYYEKTFLDIIGDMCRAILEELFETDSPKNEEDGADKENISDKTKILKHGNSADTQPITQEQYDLVA